jgi:hypothetical protein
MLLRSILTLTAVSLLLTACVEETNPNNDREDFLGNWTCNEYEGDFAPQTYDVEVLPTGDGNDVVIRGLYNQGTGFDVVASVSGNTIDIPTQNEDGFTIAGRGTINNNLDRVELSFTADDGSGPDDVRATWLR